MKIQGLTDSDQAVIERWADKKEAAAPETAGFRYMGRWFGDMSPFLIWLDSTAEKATEEGDDKKQEIETRGTELVNRPLRIAETWLEYWAPAWGWLRYR